MAWRSRKTCTAMACVDDLWPSVEAGLGWAMKSREQWRHKKSCRPRWSMPASPGSVSRETRVPLLIWIQSRGTGSSKASQAFAESLGDEPLLRSALEGVALGAITFQSRNTRKVLPVDAEWHQKAPLDIRGISDATLLVPAGTLCPTTMLALQNEGFLRPKIRIR